MTQAEVLRRLRLFLLALTALLFVGTLLELWLVNHTEDVVQWVPFVLAGGGLLLTFIVILRPQPAIIRLLRWWTLLLIAGSVFGVYEHVSNNISFEREINPNASQNRLLWRGLSGPNPLLAPGTLAIAALLALAATYKYTEGTRE